MKVFRLPLRGPMALGLGVALLLSACGQGNTSGDSDGGNGEGSIYVSGSSTVEPVSFAVAEAFAAENPDFEYTVEGPGTGDGFALFCTGETDISDASRPIREEEIAECQANGIEYVELEIAIDGLTVGTHPENDAVTCVTPTDLYALLGPESEDVANWSDANPLADELGDLEDFPPPAAAPYPEDLELVISAPGEESGTFDSFIELADFADIAEAHGFELGEDEPPIRLFEGNPNDSAIIEGLAGAEGSLGWVGFAFYINNEEAVKALEVDTGDGCVAPSAETIADGSYPFARSLYIYVNTAKAEENPTVAAYVDYYLSDDGLSHVADEGYVDLPEDRIQATRDAWESR